MRDIKRCDKEKIKFLRQIFLTNDDEKYNCITVFEVVKLTSKRLTFY